MYITIIHICIYVYIYIYKLYITYIYIYIDIIYTCKWQHHADGPAPRAATAAQRHSTAGRTGRNPAGPAIYIYIYIMY